MKKLLIKLSLAVVAISLATQAKADFTWNFSYTDGSTVIASGTFTISGNYVQNLVGTGLDGYQIISISGVRNNVPFNVLDSNPTFFLDPNPDISLPYPGLYQNFLGVIFDNGLYINNPVQLDYWGLSYFVGTDEYNLYAGSDPLGGGYFEAVNGDYGNAVPVDLTITPVLVPEASTMVAGALMALPLGVSVLRILRNRKAA